MQAKQAMGLLLLLSASCVSTCVPDYIRHPEDVRIFVVDENRSCVLSAEEANTLVSVFDGRLFSNASPSPATDMGDKKPILGVAYRYPAGETHIHIYADGTAGYVRTIKTYHAYPMREYCKTALDLARKHGLVRGD